MKRESGGVASILISDLPDTSLTTHPQIDLVQDLISRQISLLPKPENYGNDSPNAGKDQSGTNSANSAVVNTPPIHGESILLEPDDEARIKAELEIEIERDIEREIKAKIMMLNKKLEDLHVQQTKRHCQVLDQQAKEFKSGVMERDYAKGSQTEDLKEVIKEETLPKLPDVVTGTCSALPATELSFEASRPSSAPSSLVDEPLPKISWNLMTGTAEAVPSPGKQMNGFRASVMPYPGTPPRMIMRELGPSSTIRGQSIQNGDVDAVSYLKKPATPVTADCKRLAADHQEHHNEKAHVCHKCSRAARHSNVCASDKIQRRPQKFDWTQTLRSDDLAANNRQGPNTTKDNWKSVVRNLFAEDKSSVGGKEKHRRAISSTFGSNNDSCVYNCVSEKSSDTVSSSSGEALTCADAAAAGAVSKQVSVGLMGNNRQRAISAGRSCQQPITPHECKSVSGNSGVKFPSPQVSRKAAPKSNVWK